MLIRHQISYFIFSVIALSLYLLDRYPNILLGAKVIDRKLLCIYTQYMNVGFFNPRPRLKGRPSFYDLVRERNIDQLSVSTPKLHKTEAVPSIPLPQSPTTQPLISHPPFEEEIPIATEELPEQINMAPVSFYYSLNLLSCQ